MYPGAEENAGGTTTEKKVEEKPGEKVTTETTHTPGQPEKNDTTKTVEKTGGDQDKK